MAPPPRHLQHLADSAGAMLPAVPIGGRGGPRHAGAGAAWGPAFLLRLGFESAARRCPDAPALPSHCSALPGAASPQLPARQQRDGDSRNCPLSSPVAGLARLRTDQLVTPVTCDKVWGLWRLPGCLVCPPGSPPVSRDAFPLLAWCGHASSTPLSSPSRRTSRRKGWPFPELPGHARSSCCPPAPRQGCGGQDPLPGGPALPVGFGGVQVGAGVPSASPAPRGGVAHVELGGGGCVSSRGTPPRDADVLPAAWHCHDSTGMSLPALGPESPPEGCWHPRDPPERVEASPDPSREEGHVCALPAPGVSFHPGSSDVPWHSLARRREACLPDTPQLRRGGPGLAAGSKVVREKGCGCLHSPGGPRAGGGWIVPMGSPLCRPGECSLPASA